MIQLHASVFFFVIYYGYTIDFLVFIFLTKSTLFDVLDANHDNTIDFNEFLFLAAVGNRTGSLDERLDIIFDLLVIQTVSLKYLTLFYLDGMFQMMVFLIKMKLLT